MSVKRPGGLITKTKVTPAGPFTSGAASGVWTLQEAYQWIGKSLWPTAGNNPAFYSLFGDVSKVYAGAAMMAASGSAYLAGRESDPAGKTLYISKWPSAGAAPTWQRAATDSSLTSIQVIDGTIDSADAPITLLKGYDGSNDQSTLVKYNTSGVFQWARDFGTTGRHADGAAIGVDSSDNVFLWTNSTSTGYAEIVKWNSSGTIQFQKSATTAGASVGNTLDANLGDMTITSNDYIIPAGKAASHTGSGTTVGSVANITAAGVLDWHREIAGYVNGIAAVEADSSNNILLGAKAGTSPANVPYIMKLNSAGVKQWARKIEGSASGTIWSNATVKRIAIDASDNVYMVANGDLNNSGSGGANNEAIMVFKYNSSGVLQWSRYIQGSRSHMGNTTKITIDGSDMLIGTYARIVTSPNMTSMFYIKIPTDGSKTGSYTNSTYTDFTLTYGVLSVAESEDTTSSESSEDYTLATTTITEGASGLTSSTSTLAYNNHSF